MKADSAELGSGSESDFELALETSRRAASLAIACRGEVHAEEGLIGQHASDLLPRLERLLQRVGIERRHGRWPLARIHLGLGPGSYTGLRVGFATALGLQRATGAPLFGLGSFEALAFEALSPGEEAAVALDARGGRYYYSRLRRTLEAVLELEPLEAVPAESLRAKLFGAPWILGEPSLGQALGLSSAESERLRARAPSARGVLSLARARLALGTLAPLASPEPLYLTGFTRS